MIDFDVCVLDHADAAYLVIINNGLVNYVFFDDFYKTVVNEISIKRRVLSGGVCFNHLIDESVSVGAIARNEWEDSQRRRDILSCMRHEGLLSVRPDDLGNRNAVHRLLLHCKLPQQEAPHAPHAHVLVFVLSSCFAFPTNCIDNWFRLVSFSFSFSFYFVFRLIFCERIVYVLPLGEQHP